MKNLTTFINIQTDYKEYQEMFDAAETDNMVNEELVAYSESLQRMRDYQSGLDYVRKESYDDGVSKGFEKGRAEGRAEGIEEGRMDGLRESARKMLGAGLDTDFIHEMTGLSMEEIKALR